MQEARAGPGAVHGMPCGRHLTSNDGGGNTHSGGAPVCFLRMELRDAGLKRFQDRMDFRE
jgi:hypothetical protein